MTQRILIVDDELSWCEFLKSELQDNNFKVFCESKAENALQTINATQPDAILLDVLFGDANKGKELFREIKRKHKQLTVIMLTNTVVEENFLLDDYPGCAFPYAKSQLTSGMDEAYEDFADKIRRAITRDKAEGDSFESEFDFVVGKTKFMKDVCRQILNAAPTNATVLITGETGVGKGVIARATKEKSERSKKKFIARSCTDFPDENLLISALFGHEPGAFTGAGNLHVGIFEEAMGGTVFIDEIGDATPEAQRMLLKVVDEKIIRRLGGKSDIAVDVRIISATNRDFEELIKLGKFKDDLFHRLNDYTIHLPPLRKRKVDLPELLAYFIKKYNSKHQKKILGAKEDERDCLRQDVLDLLTSYDWPGNIREFEKRVSSAMINAGDSNILLTNFFDIPQGDPVDIHPPNVEEQVNEVFEGKWYGEEKWNTLVRTHTREWQKEFFERCIERLKKNKNKTLTSSDIAELFGIKENNMRQRIHVLGINWREMKKV